MLPPLAGDPGPIAVRNTQKHQGITNQEARTPDNRTRDGFLEQPVECCRACTAPAVIALRAETPLKRPLELG